MNLQEADLRSVKIGSDDPLHLSTHSDNSLPSFVAVPGATESTIIANHTREEVENYVGRLGDKEVGGSTRYPQYNSKKGGEIEGEEVGESFIGSVKV